jgi:hypothetical protein
LKAIFNYSTHFKNVDLIFRRVFKKWKKVKSYTKVRLK